MKNTKKSIKKINKKIIMNKRKIKIIIKKMKINLFNKIDKMIKIKNNNIWKNFKMMSNIQLMMMKNSDSNLFYVLKIRTGLSTGIYFNGLIIIITYLLNSYIN